MRGIHRTAKNCLLAQKRYGAAESLSDEDALDILAEWDTDTLRNFYVKDSLSLDEFEAILDCKFELA